MAQVLVGVGEYAVGDAPDDVLATYALGSCIALVVHDSVAGVGGMAHYMLPDSSIDTGQRRGQACVFADVAVPLLLEAVVARGASLRRLRAHAAGGARMAPAASPLDIGKRNREALQRELARAGLTLTREATGGSVSRNVRLAVGTGAVRIWESGHGK